MKNNIDISVFIEGLTEFNGIKTKLNLPDTDREVWVRSGKGYIQSYPYRYKKGIWQWKRGDGSWIDAGNPKFYKILEWSEI